jgi:hypothetical protein
MPAGEWNLTRRRLLSGAAGTTAAVELGSTSGAGQTAPVDDLLEDSGFGDDLRVGAGEASLAWRAGAKPGQVGSGAGTSLGRKPYPHSTVAEPGEGFHSEPTAKAIVLESGGGRYALVKADAYLIHEFVHRRVAELTADAGIVRERLVVSATHNHNVPHLSTTGLAIASITDVFDLRHWSYQTRQLARAVERAVASLRPATVRAVESTFDAVQENIIGPAVATEKANADRGPLEARNQGGYEQLTDEAGDPIRAGFPPDHVEDQIVVLRFDTPGGDPIAATLTMGMHPESMEGGHGLTTGEYVGMVERRLERHVGGEFLAAFLNGALGDIEPSRGNVGQPDWWRESFARTEEMADVVGEEAVRLFELAGEVAIPEDPDRPEAAPTELPDSAPGAPPEDTPPQRDGTIQSSDRSSEPHSRPDPIDRGDETILAYGRDVEVAMASLRLAPPEGSPGPTSSYVSQAAGSGLEMPSTGAAQESASPFLTAFALGDVLLTTYPGEPISDVSFNLRTRVVDGFDDVYQGYHWSENPAWVRDRIAENFSTTTVDDGYEIAATLSIANAWQGYFVTRWEYDNRNHYRQSLTPYGAESADYVNSALVDLAAELRGERTATSRVSAVEAADSGRREAAYRTLVAAEESSVRGYWASIPPAGDGVGGAVSQPAATGRFEAARFSWVGGSNAVDVPRVTLQRRRESGWQEVTTSATGELVVTTAHPWLYEEPEQLTARQREWTVAWEVPWNAPPGEYRFHVEGTARGTAGSSERSFFDPTGSNTTYEVTSEPFTARGGTIPLSEEYTSVTVTEGRVRGRLAFEAPFRAVDRPADGTEIPVELVGEETVETVGTYDTDGFYVDAAAPAGDVTVVVEEGAYVDNAGNPTAAVERSVE